MCSDDSWKLALPAVLYLLQNQLQFVAAAHLDLPTFQVTYNFKIFSTALFSLAFRQRLSHRTWAAIIILVAGVGVVHSSLLETPIAGASMGSGPEKDRFRGIVAAYFGCCLSGLAGVSLESVLKQQPGTDLSIRNCQLSLFSLIPALLMALLCIIQAAGGILTGYIIRNSGGNVSKGFATSLAFLVSFAVGALPVSFAITPKLLLGTIWIILASFLHGIRGDRRSSSRSRAPSLRHQAIYDPKVNSIHSMHTFPSVYAPALPSPTRKATPPPSSPRRATLCEPHSSPQTPVGFDALFNEALISTPTHLITASHSTLTAFPLAGGASATSTPHSALIRILAFHAPNYLISTGEDKKLVVSTLPGLEVLSSRELNKRANGVAVTPEGTILVGDKFGDVYSYPLLTPPMADPAPPPVAGAKAEKPTPILGHVSMLTAVVFLPASTDATSSHPAYVVSGDRDEHVRVSRYPRGEVIEKFLWGSKKFIASLLHLSSPTHGPLILSAGGDSTLQLFSLLTGATLSRFPVEAALLPHVVVAPVAPFAVTKGQKIRTKRAKETKKGTQEVKEAAAVEVAPEKVEESGQEDAAAQEDEEVEGGDAGGPRSRKGPHAWKDGVTTGLAVIKLVEVPNRGVVVLAAGSTAILFVPFCLLIPSSTPSNEQTSLLDLGFSIIDVVNSSADNSLLHIAFDLSRSAPSPSTPAADAHPVRTVRLSAAGTLELVDASELESVLKARAVEVTKSAPLPALASLYPVLSFLVGNEEEENGGDDGGNEPIDTRQQKKDNKRPQPPSDSDVVHPARKIGKRAEGRLEFQQKIKTTAGPKDEKVEGEQKLE
ncbi:hypothetical protein RQP46_007461 [Phenoliferia psychrophenolica]